MTCLSNKIWVFGVLLVCIGFGTAVRAQAVDPVTRTVTLGLSGEPPTLNSLESTDSASAFILAHVQEGLLRYNARGEIAPGVAERWEMGERRAHFWLRHNARWSDGKPVTAHDFVFAWRQALRPETASQYAFILYPLKNAEAVNRGELPAEALGVRAVGDDELEVELERPCPYFAGLTAFMTYYPVREDFFRQHGSRYAADAADMLSNGPFVLDRWVHGASLSLARNAYYWQADDVKIDRIDFPHITSDPRALFNLYRNNSIAMTGLTREFLGAAISQGYPVRQFMSGSMAFVEINHRADHPTHDLKLRQAIQALFDPAGLVNRIIALPGIKPADTLFPGWVRGEAGPLVAEYPPPVIEHSLSRARQLMREYLAGLGRSVPPALVLLTGDDPVSVQEAEYLQYLFRTGLGIDLRIDKQIFKQRLEKMRTGDFDLVIAGWGPDYDDAMTFADLFSSWNENNRGQYVSPEYDRLVQLAQSTTDGHERVKAMAALQRLIVEDVVILPLYEGSTAYVQHPQLKGVVRSIFGGDPNFRYAWIDPPPATGSVK